MGKLQSLPNPCNERRGFYIKQSSPQPPYHLISLPCLIHQGSILPISSVLYQLKAIEWSQNIGEHHGTPQSPEVLNFVSLPCKPSFSHHFPMKTTTFSPAFRHPGRPCSILQGVRGEWQALTDRQGGKGLTAKLSSKKNGFLRRKKIIFIYGIWMGFLWDLKWDLNGIWMGFLWDLNGIWATGCLI